jgi:hypothetical protein
MPGLSDADRERLRREQQRVQKALAAERKRLEAERERQALAEAKHQLDQQLEQVHRRRFGPLQITGPDGVWVHLVVRPTGGARFRQEPPSRSGPLGLEPEYGRFSMSNVVVLVALAQAVTPFGFVLRIDAHGLQHRYRRRRVRDEDTAAVLFAEAARSVEAGGLAALRSWASRRGARSRPAC